MKRFVLSILSLYLLLLGPVAAAQDSPVVNRFEPTVSPAILDAIRGDSEVAPDTTEPWRYFPLEVGNSWEYVNIHDGLTTRKFIEKDTLRGGQLYVVYNEQVFLPNGLPEGEPLRFFLRYDTLSANVMRYGTYENPQTLCPLNLDFGVEEVECPYGTTWISGGYDRLLVFPRTDAPDDSVYTAVKVMINFSSREDRYAADFGLVYLEFHGGGWALRAARLGGWDGTVYGELRYPPNPVSSESGPARGPALTVEAWPNPFRERVTVAFSLTEAAPVVVELVDVLGRVVRRRDLGVLPAGDHREAVGAEALPSGSYVARVHRGAEVAVSRMLTRVR